MINQNDLLYINLKNTLSNKVIKIEIKIILTSISVHKFYLV